jgi:hypothetical protein
LLSSLGKTLLVSGRRVIVHTWSSIDTATVACE